MICRTVRTSSDTTSVARVPPGTAGDGVTCNDVNECAFKSGGCRFRSGVASTPRARGIAARCDEGYEEDGATQCDDIDECEEETDECNHETDVCVNAQAPTNATTSTNARTTTTTTAPWGRSGETPTPVTNATTSTSAKRRPTSAISSVYSARTPRPGYDCVDIDECEEETDDCTEEEECENTVGGFECNDPGCDGPEDCDPNAICAEGVCEACDNAPFTSSCDNTCVDINTDEDYCGICEIQCDVNEVCFVR